MKHEDHDFKHHHKKPCRPACYVGQEAPEWKGTAYVNGAEKEISSEDYKGKWYILYWYPLDFTFVCPTEIVGFEKLRKDFADDGIAIIGCSTDSFHSHAKWFADKGIFPDGVNHPVLADTSHKITNQFGVLHKEKGVGFRATVIVDDKGIIQSYCINNLDVGRSPAETLRTAQACLSGGLCGANWSKGTEFVG